MLILLARRNRRWRPTEKVVVWGTDGYPYAATWVTNASTLVSNLQSRGWQTKNAAATELWMQQLIQQGDGRGAVVLFLGQAPDTILETEDGHATLRRFLNVDGRVLWISDVPIYYVGHADGSRTPWGWGGSTAVLGVTSEYGPSGWPAITSAGSAWGLGSGWAGGRPLSTADSVDVALASTVVNPGASYTGPSGGTVSSSDIMQLSMDLASGNAVAIGCDIVSILIPGVPAPAAKYAARSIDRVLPSLVRRGDDAVDLARRILSAADKVTAWNYRDVFFRHNPRLSRLANLIDLEVHHVIPQRFREQLGSAVIDNYFNLVAVPRPLHKVITMEWEAWVKAKLALGEQIRACPDLRRI